MEMKTTVLAKSCLVVTDEKGLAQPAHSQPAGPTSQPAEPSQPEGRQPAASQCLKYQKIFCPPQDNSLILLTYSMQILSEKHGAYVRAS